MTVIVDARSLIEFPNALRRGVLSARHFFYHCPHGYVEANHILDLFGTPGQSNREPNHERLGLPPRSFLPSFD
jgi:hypothetical protein